jgi:hypothetical protein
MTYRKGRYAAYSKLKLPEIHGVQFILYGFNSADINGNGKHETLMLDDNHRLRVYSPSGRALVHSQEVYGRDPRSFDLGVRVEGAGIVQEGEPVSYRGRLQLIRQGQNRYLLLPKNTSTGGSLIPGLMIDTHGSITFLKLTPDAFSNPSGVSLRKVMLPCVSIIKPGMRLPPVEVFFGNRR